MIRFLPLLILSAFVFTGCQNCPPCPDEVAAAASTPATALTPADRTFLPGKRIGAITSGMQLADLERMFGADQVVPATLYGPEGITYEGFRFLPGTDDELEMVIYEEGISATASKPGGHWASAKYGVRVGTSLAELNRLNGKPFKLSGFGWDYGGSVTDWEGGALEGHGVTLNYDAYLMDEDGPFYEQALGDIELMSDLPALQDAGVRVSALYFSAEK
jgi:hypothetical protein